MRSERRLPAGLCAAVLCATLALASSAGAAGAPTPQNVSPRPNPHKLWKRYPLTPRPSGSSARSSAAVGSTASSDGHSVLLPLLWITFFVGALTWAISFARVIRRPQPSRAGARSAPGAEDLADALLGAVRRVKRTAKRQIQQRKSRR